MSDAKPQSMVQAQPSQALDGGLAALSLIAGYYRIAADPPQLRHQLALTGRLARLEDLVRAANLLKLKSRIVRGVTARRLVFFGAQSVIEGSMSVGELIAFNMIASQEVQPILRRPSVGSISTRRRSPARAGSRRST